MAHEDAARRALLDRRLIIVTGKGGTGKTSVVGALAVAAADQGRRVLVAETGRDEHLPRVLAPGSAPVGFAGRELLPGLRVMRIDPYDALSEYLGLQLKVPGLARRVVANNGFRQLMDAAPGWRELITLGKVWHLQQERDRNERPVVDLLIVDAPATGHGLTFLDVPRVVGAAVRTGPLRRHAGWVEAMLRDEESTLLLPVALGEELPARETVELVDRVRREIRVPVDRVVVNAVVQRPFPADLPDLDERLARLPDTTIPGLPPIPVIARCAGHLRSRWELNRRYVELIETETGLPAWPLPLLTSGIRGADDLRVLASALLGAPLQEAA